MGSRNIDRIFAIWQALNPNTWDWHQPLLDGGTFVSPQGTDENPESPLVPFRKSRNGDHAEWWTSNDLRDCRLLGYNYPQLAKAVGNVASLRQWVTENYEWTTIYGEAPPRMSLTESVGTLDNIEALPDTIRIDGIGNPIDREPVHEEEEEEEEEEDRPFFSKIFHRNEKHAGAGGKGARDRYRHIRPLLADGKLTHWNLTIKVEKFALNGPFQVFIFLHSFSPSADPTTWAHSASLVGIDAIFAPRGRREGCAHCREQAARRIVDSDVISLTSSLIKFWMDQEVHCGIRLGGLKPAEVLPFLRACLHVRILDVSFLRLSSPPTRLVSV